jgi:hypothetical protein
VWCAMSFASFAGYVGVACILNALVLPLLFDGLQMHTVLLDYFTFMLGAFMWMKFGTSTPTAQLQESPAPQDPRP